MSRAPSAIVLAGTLSLGLLLGLVAGRLGPTVSAQQAPGATTTATAKADVPARVEETKKLSGSDDAIYQELGRQYDGFRQVDRTFELVAKVVSPAVVHIVAKKEARRDDGTLYRYEETGSGVIVRDDARRELYILTNHHVVDGASAGDVNIFLHDGRVVRPERFWTDAKADVAVVRLGRNDLPAARLGNSDEARVGTWVLALGSPFGLTHSVSHGIISARGRHETELEDDGVENQDFLQTDAAINPGNSGGPLVNLKGEVIGINTAIASEGGGSEGVGFSIPINLAKWIMRQLVATGRVSRGALGVKLQQISPQLALELGLDRPRGARIQSVYKSSPADRGGVTAGDIILRYNETEVIDYNHLINLISMTPVGHQADLVLWRDRQSVATKVTIADRDVILPAAAADPERTTERGGPLRRSPRPEPPPEMTGSPSSTSILGVELVTLDVTVARRLNLPESLRGAAVFKVEPSSPLAAYLRPSDVITSAWGRPVLSAEEAAKALNRRPDRNRTALDLVVQRPSGGTVQRFTVQVP
jgi:serine protease Do